MCSFFKGDVQVEVFGQAQSTVQQFAYRHMVVEHAILEIGEEKWRAAVRRAKRTGIKTEPAFASLLRLPGNPYDVLLTLEGMSTVELTALMIKCVI